MADAEKKAVDYMSQADKKLRSVGGLFGSVFGGSTKTDEAVELYSKAANAFKMAKNWKAAGDAFCRAAVLHIRCKTNHEAASQYVEAANCYRKITSAEAVKVLMKAIEIYTDMGRFRIAAKHHTTVAEIYEKDYDFQKAVVHYEKAAEYYQGEESSCSANKCLLKVAQFSAEAGNYQKAINIYEQVAFAGMNNHLLRYGAKEYFFRAALCRLCCDAQDASNSVTRYEASFPAFTDSRECNFIKQLASACLDEDSDSFASAIEEFTRVVSLDQWYRTLLKRIREGLDKEYDLR